MVGEGRRLLGLAGEQGIPVRLLGGVAVRLHAEDVPASLQRECKDLDLVAPRGSSKSVSGLLRESGYEPHVAFNAMNGRERLLFLDEQHGRQVDVFVRSFRMCHEIPLEDRLTVDEDTVPLAELLLTKLQIIELNEKDVRDTVALLLEHEVTDDDAGVNGARIAALCANDWGLWRTITANLATVRAHADGYPGAARERVERGVDALLHRIESAPKSRGWRLRAKVGDRKRWYETPEEV